MILNSCFGHQFANTDLLTQALTHRSAAAAHNERFEFLGDAILGMLIASELFQRNPEATEGQLTRLRSHLVREETLAVIAREHKLGGRLILGPGELGSADWRRESILADAVEAVLAAIYLDAGLDAARAAIQHLYAKRWDRLPDADSLKDAKTQLQEWTQGHPGWELPVYALVEESGPPHRRLFKVSGSLQLPAGGTVKTIFAEGRSRRRAEQETARELLSWVNEVYGP